ncbi:MAG: ABC transporter permease subunit, partial [Pseudomonadota bacterium]
MSALRVAPAIAIGTLTLPIVFGLMGTILPAFGYLPALGGQSFSLTPWADLLEQPAIWRSAFQACGVGLAATAIAVMLVALFTAGWYGTRLFSRLQNLVSPLLAVPHAAAAFGFAFMIMPSGFIARAFSPWATGWTAPPDWLIVNDTMGLALLAGLVLKEIPFLLLITLAALPQVPAHRSLRFAQSVGYGRTAGFLLTVWPSIYPQVRFAIFAVIAYATANVDMAVILGPTVPQTLPVRLAIWMNDPQLTVRFMACAGACLQIGVTVAALLSWIGLEKLGAQVRDYLSQKGLRFSRDHICRYATSALVVTGAVTIFVGLLTLGVWSFSGLWQFPDFAPQNLTLRTWERTLPRLGDPLKTTVIIGTVAVLVSLLLTIGCLAREDETGRGRGSRALLLIYLPLLVPQIGFLFGLQLLFVSSNTNATWFAVILVHIVFVLPYVFLSLSAPWRAFDRRYEAIAAGLGKGRFSTLISVRLPMLLRAILAAAAVGFAVSIGQYLPTLLIGAGRFATITTEAIALGAGGNRRLIGVYA